MNITKKHPSFSSFITDEIFGDLFGPVSKIKNQIFGPATNIVEREKELQMQLVLPGVSKEHLKINIEDNRLTVGFENIIQSEIDNESFLRREFEMSSFQREFIIPSNIDKENISSKLENGILNIILPKKDNTSSKSKMIDIQ